MLLQHWKTHETSGWPQIKNWW